MQTLREQLITPINNIKTLPYNRFNHFKTHKYIINCQLLKIVSKTITTLKTRRTRENSPIDKMWYLVQYRVQIACSRDLRQRILLEHHSDKKKMFNSNKYSNPLRISNLHQPLHHPLNQNPYSKNHLRKTNQRSTPKRLLNLLLPSWKTVERRE